MHFSHVKLGQEVIVTSDCFVNGLEGTVVKLDSPNVYVNFKKLPFFYKATNPVRLVANSLELVEKSKPEVEENFDDVRIGVFYCYTSTDSYITNNYFSTEEEVLIVKAKSKEACMKILADLIANGDVDDEEYDMFAFDNHQYKIKTQVCVVIDDD